MDKKEIQERLKASLKDKRFIHSLGVCDEAVRMAKQFGADEDKAYIAGLLHDCAKNLTRTEETELCKKYDVEIDNITLICQPVMHAPLGAVVAQYEYGINDSEILDAIRYHTVARSDMTLLDKIIYVADMIEPSRDFEGASRLRELSKTSIDSAYREALRQSLIHNIGKGTVIHPNTLDAWNEVVIKE